MAIKAGDFITITKRKCSPKIQPYLKEGGHYCVESVDKLKDGTKVLVLFRDLKKTTRCNANRFEWSEYKKKDIAERMTQFQMDMFEKKINAKCTDEENAMISFRPVMLMMIMWHYGDKVLEYCRKNKLNKFVKASRELREIRENTMKYLEGNIERDEVNKIRRYVCEFIDEYKFDFSMLKYNVKNVFLIRDLYVDHADLYMNALIGIMMCRELYSYELKAERILAEKNIHHKKEYHLPYRKDFFLCISKFLDGVSYELSSHVNKCMETFERNFEEIEFVKEES